MAQWRDTEYVEHIPGSPKGSFGRDGSRHTRVIDVIDSINEVVDQAHLNQAAQDFIGYPVLNSIGGVKYIQRNTPAPHPQYPLAYCVAIADYQSDFPRGQETILAMGPGRDGIDIEPIAIYERWRCTMSYETLPFKVLTDAQMIAGGFSVSGVPDEASVQRYVSKSAESSGKFVTVPLGVMYYWPPGATVQVPVLEGSPIWIPEGSPTFTWYDIPEAAVPWTAIKNCQGQINAAAFDVFDAQTLVFLSWKLIPTTDIAGFRTYTIQYMFKWAPNLSRGTPGSPPAGTVLGQNWRLGYRQGTPATVDYVLVGTKMSAVNTLFAGATPLYRLVDFNTLFRPEP